MAKVRNKKQIKNDTNKLYVFRRYKKPEGKAQVKHPKLIVDADQKDFGFMGLTKSSKKGKHHRNIPLKKNPEKGNPNKAFLRRKIVYDNKDNFEAVLSNYNLSKEDREFVVDYVNKHKKRRSMHGSRELHTGNHLTENITKNKSSVKTKKQGGKK